MRQPTEAELERVVYAIGTMGPLEARRVAQAIGKLIQGQTVDEVLRADLASVG